MVSVTRTLKRWGAALARRMGLDANPLRRGCDRAEAWVRLGLVLVFLIASPLAAIGLGHLTNDASVRAARAEAAAEFHIPAVLLHKVSRNSDDPLYATSELAWARARWTAPDGRQRVGEVPAAVGSRAGRPVMIWVNRPRPAGLPADRGGPDREPGHRGRRAHPRHPGGASARRELAGPEPAGPPPDIRLGLGVVGRRASVDQADALTVPPHPRPRPAGPVTEVLSGAGHVTLPAPPARREAASDESYSAGPVGPGT